MLFSQRFQFDSSPIQACEVKSFGRRARAGTSRREQVDMTGTQSQYVGTHNCSADDQVSIAERIELVGRHSGTEQFHRM